MNVSTRLASVTTTAAVLLGMLALSPSASGVEDAQVVVSCSEADGVVHLAASAGQVLDFALAEDCFGAAVINRLPSVVIGDDVTSGEPGAVAGFSVAPDAAPESYDDALGVTLEREGVVVTYAQIGVDVVDALDESMSAPAEQPVSNVADPPAPPPADGDEVVARPAEPTIEPGVSRLIVQYERGVEPIRPDGEVTANAAVPSIDLEAGRPIGDNMVTVELPAVTDEGQAQQFADQLTADPRVAWAKPDRWVQATADFPQGPPSDTNYASLWNLWGAFGVGIGSSLNTMTDVWAQQQGAGAVVAVIDTGIVQHGDLDANVLPGYDFVQSFVADSWLVEGKSLPYVPCTQEYRSPTPYVTECYRHTDGTKATGPAMNNDADADNPDLLGGQGWDPIPLDPGEFLMFNTTPGDYRTQVWYASDWHGSHVAGTVAAVADNGKGVAGIAPLAKIVPVRVLSWMGGFDSDILSGIIWAGGGDVPGVPRNENPADVINTSLGGRGLCGAALQQAIDDATARKAIVVVAGGNDAMDAAGDYPANCRNVVTVGATGLNGKLASYSNFGTTIDISAPGGDEGPSTDGVYSTVSASSTTPSGVDGYRSLYGTSMAAPAVSGVVALMKAKDHTITFDQVLARLALAATPFPDGSCDPDPLRDHCGPGIVNARAALPRWIAPTSQVVSATQGMAIASTSAIASTGFNDPASIAFTITPPLPSGLTLSPATGVIAGTPAESLPVSDFIIRGTSTADPGQVATARVSISVTTARPPQSESASPTTVSQASPVPASAPGQQSLAAVQPTGSANATMDGRSVDLSVTPRSDGRGMQISGAGLILSLASTVIAPGGSAVVEATGYAPGSAVGFFLIPTSGAPRSTSTTASLWLGNGDSSNTGRLAATIPIPAGLAQGDYALQLNGYDASASLVSVNVGVRVASDLAPSVPASSMARTISFMPRSPRLTPSSRSSLRALVNSVAGSDSYAGRVTVFVSTEPTRAELRLAQRRALTVKHLLEAQGATGPMLSNTAVAPNEARQNGGLVMMTPPRQFGGESISALIVGYRPGTVVPIGSVPVGAKQVTGPVRSQLRVDAALGLDMYRVTITPAVSPAVAARVAHQLTADPAVRFAELDSLLHTRR